MKYIFRGAYLVNKTVLGVLVSGRGSNLQSILDAIQAGKIPAEVGVVISDKPDAKALDRAKSRGIPAIYLERKKFANKQEFEAAIIDALRQHQVELVVLAGFMRILSSNVINAFAGRIMNIHPALLPAFTGLDAQKQAIDYGVKVAGCTVHFVDEGMDTGPIILQQAVPVFDDDTPETLSERILQEEHKLYPRAIELYCRGMLHRENRKVRIVKGDDERL